MSVQSYERGGRGTGDICNIVISIPGQNRTDPPDKLSSPTEEATFGESYTGTASALQAERVRSPELCLGELPQQHQRHDHQHRGRKYQQHQITPEKQFSLHQVWIPNQFAHQQTQERQQTQEQQPQERQLQERHVQEQAVIVNVALPLCTSYDTDVSKPCCFLEETDNLDKETRTKHAEVHHFKDNSNSSSVKHNLTETSSNSFVSPRLQRCSRQSRVLSFDEPPSDDTISEKSYGIHPYQADGENDYHTFVNGSSQGLVPGIPGELQQTTVAFSECDVRVSPTKETYPAEISHSVITIQKRSSFDNTSVANGADRDTVLVDKSWSSRKKNKKNKDAACSKNGTGTSSFPATGENEQNTDALSQTEDGGIQPHSTTRGTKAARRLAKRGIGMFPSSNWRRLRNTLKAANEMQSSRKQRSTLNREDSFLRKFSTRNHQNVQNPSNSIDEEARKACIATRKLEGRFVIQHDGNFMFYWLGVVTVSVLYNLWTCIAREAFREIQQGCTSCWYSLDAVFDCIYICDILVQFRTGYLDQGLMVYDSKKLRQKYAKSKVIYIDFICLLPLDFVQLVIGVHPMIRFPRFLKIYRPFRFLHMLESRTAYPNLIRVANLTHILFLGAHWFAAFYYMISEAEGFKGEWSYPKPVGEFSDVTRKYLRSLFWSTLTLTTIGDIPPPGNSNDLRMSNAAYVFVIVSYLIGVFVFATIVGQVGNVINNRNASRQEFERLLDGAKIYMQTHNVPHNLQKRVQRWYDYVWSRGRLNGCDINSLGLLPDKLKTELAIHVNLETLKKVTIFQECQPEFLHDLVLKMKAYIFTPGDLICRRGEVAREMFIIADGVVEIISESGVMLKRMGAGDFFGEIGILNLDGGINRRTADVRSVGYLELFVLSREDVLAALKDHPEAESIIRDYGQRRLREVEAHRQKVKPLKCRGSTEPPGNPVGTPQTVQNRFLQTLRSLNPAIRRQSSQTNHVGSPPPVSGSPPDLQRCVNHRGSPINKPVSVLTRGSSVAQSGLAVVSLDRTDFSTGAGGNRYPEEYAQRRQSFAYFRTAYARFRNVFHRRRGQRRSVDISGNRRRELWENRLLFKSSDNKSASVDFSANSRAFTPGCNVTLNVEDCSEVIKTPGSVTFVDNVEEDNETNKKEQKTSLTSGVKRGSLLFPGLSDDEARKHGQNLGRVMQRKYSEPVSYMPVCTEDLDERYARLCQQVANDREADAKLKMVHDIKLNSQIWSQKGSSTNDEAIARPDGYQDTSIIESSICKVVDVDSLSFTSNTGSKLNDYNVNGSHDNIVSCSSLSNVNNCDPVHFIVNDHTEMASNVELQGDDLIKVGVSEGNVSSLLDDNIGSSIENHETSSSTPLQRKSFSSYPTHTPTAKPPSAKHRFLDRTPSLRSNGRVSSQTSTQADPQRRHSGCVFNIGVTAEEITVPSSSLLTASPSPFTLSCHCDPAENFKKFIGCHLPESIHHKLVKKKTEVTAPELLGSCNSEGQVESMAVQASSCGDVSQRTTTLCPSGCQQTGRSLSFPTLTEPHDDNDNSGVHMSRRTSYQLPEHFLFDDIPVSPIVTKLKQEDNHTASRKGGGNGVRSHPMSIIQQPTSDLSYQQLTAQISIMQGVIEKRLTLLEEAYTSATEKLENLATSQDLLVRLIKQQMLTNQTNECIQLCSQDEDGSQSSTLI